MIRIPIAKIRRDGGTQPREALDAAVIAEYAEAMRGGTEFPPVVVFYDGTDYWLADGFHRVAAAETLGRPNDTIPAEVRQGTQREAILCSTGVNDAHGLRRNDADKRRAVQTLLADPEWGRWSNREIARQAKVSEFLVRSMRELSAIESQIDPVSPTPDPLSPTPTERTVTRSGTTYTMQTGGIGQAPNYATVEALQPAVRAWVQALSDDATAQRHILAQIGLQNQVGMDHIERLYQFSGTPKPCRRADLRLAAEAVFRAWGRAEAKAVVWAPESGVRGQESGVRGQASGVRGQASGVRGPEGPEGPGGAEGERDLFGGRPAGAGRKALCRICGRPLTDPESVANGFGPECAGKATGHAGRRAADVGSSSAGGAATGDGGGTWPRWLGPAMAQGADGGGQESGGRGQAAGPATILRPAQDGGAGPSAGSGNGHGGNGAARRPATGAQDAALRQAQGALDWLAQAKHVMGLKNAALDKASAFIGQYGPSWAESEDVAQLLAELALARATGVTAASWAMHPVA